MQMRRVTRLAWTSRVAQQCEPGPGLFQLASTGKAASCPSYAHPSGHVKSRMSFNAWSYLDFDPELVSSTCRSALSTLAHGLAAASIPRSPYILEPRATEHLKFVSFSRLLAPHKLRNQSKPIPANKIGADGKKASLETADATEVLGVQLAR
eukprot:6153978-Amphidinium_carterae.1